MIAIYIPTDVSEHLKASRLFRTTYKIHLINYVTFLIDNCLPLITNYLHNEERGRADFAWARARVVDP